nr:PREDICTED: piggyBac transposable element-derived protein 4-like isoform X1 [Megachile rotundata]
MDPYKCQRNEAILWANNSSRYCPKTKSGYVLVSSKDFAYSSLLKRNSTVFNQLYTNYGFSTKVVMNLLHRFLGNGYCVTVDNYYMSPELADLLIAQKTDIYGTVRINRRDLPTEFAKRKLQKGQIVAFQRGKILAIRWKDKKDVCLMSSIHDTSMVSFKNKKNEDILKPKIVSDYNLTMGGVDRCDQEISFHPTIRKRQKKYYKKIFLHLLDKNFESKL